MAILYQFDGIASPALSIPAFSVQASQICRIGRPAFDTIGVAVLDLLLRRQNRSRNRDLAKPVASGSYQDVLMSGYANIQIGKMLRALYGLTPTVIEELTRRLSLQLSSFRLDVPVTAYPVPVQITIALEAALATPNPVVLYHLDTYKRDPLLDLYVRNCVAEKIGPNRCAIEVVWDNDPYPVDVEVVSPPSSVSS